MSLVTVHAGLVSASTAKKRHDDLVAGSVASGDLICVSVVGAGPERGAYVVPVRVEHVFAPDPAALAAAAA